MPSMTRGPLPPSVYWRRRLAVLTVAAVLVVVIAQLLLGGSDGDSGGQASTVAASSSPTSTPTSTETSTETGSMGPRPSRGGGAPPPRSSPDEPTTTALPEPSGECSPEDVVMEPEAEPSYAFRPVTIRLQVHTDTTPACTWTLSSKSVQLRIVGGGRRMWTTIDCPRAVPTKEVTLYREQVSTVSMRWNARRSDGDRCGSHAAWAPPGDYVVDAAPLGGEPNKASFELVRPGEPLPKASSEGTDSSADPSSDPSSNPSSSTGAAWPGTATSESEEQTSGSRQRSSTQDGAEDRQGRGTRDEPTSAPS